MSDDADFDVPPQGVVARGSDGGALSRGMILYQQRRFDDAEREFRRGLSQDPRNVQLHTLLGWVLLESNKPKAAMVEAQQAVGLAPDEPESHRLMARVLLETDPKSAEAAAREAVRLAPEDPDMWSTLSAVLGGAERWPEALEAADHGLSHDPDDESNRNLRAMALTQLGRRKEADETLRGALESSPDNSHTHANLGWTRLHARQYKPALESFRESLRLNPNNDWAKAGLVEALKARNPLYRLVLAYFLWMSRLGGRAQWFLIIGLWVGIRLFRSAAESNPWLEPFVWPVLGLYIGFVLMTWLAQPLFNLTLWFNRYGWHALSDSQRKGAQLIGCLLAAAVVAGGIGFVADNVAALIAAGGLLGLVIPATGIYRIAAGTPRLVMVAFVGLMASVAAVGVTTAAMDEAGRTGFEALFGLALVAFGVMLLVSFWVVNIAVAKYPTDRE